MTDANKDGKAPPFAIFRFKDSPLMGEAGVIYSDAPSPVTAEYFPKLKAAGYDAGHQLKVLFSAPGFSLTHVWFKSGYPLPRHSHNADCLYYIIAGSLQIGTEELGPGDGFFLGSDTPYTYTVGEQGMELLEFRTSNWFDIKVLADNPAFWVKAIQEVQGKHGAWASEPPPSTVPQPAP
jgi:hypothetical protein